MKNTLLIFIFTLSTCLSFSQTRVSAFKCSGDYTQQFLYFSSTLALVKQFGKDDGGLDRFWFEFVVASPGPDPELASFAGDRIDTVLVKNPSRFVIDSDHIAGEMSDYDWAKKMPVSITFAIRLSTNEVFRGDKASGLLQKMLGSPGSLGDVTLLPALVAFDKYTIEYLRNQSDGSRADKPESRAEISRP